MSVFRDMRIGLNGTYGALIRLIIINCAVFLVVNILVSILEISNDRFAHGMISQWIDLPSSLPFFLTRFWTLFTYMFVHFSLWHLLSNMLWLYFLGRLFSDFLGGARLTGVYIIGGLSGGVLFMLVDNLLPRGGHSELLGASAGVMAVVVAVAAYSPDSRVFPFGIAMKLKWLALIAFVLTSLIDLSANTGGKVSHIGGAVFGLIYGTQLRQGKKFMERFMGLFRSGKRRTKLRVEHGPSRSRHQDDQLYNQNKTMIRRRVDEILDKISRSGYDSLSREEKDFLQKNHDKF